MSLSVRTKPTPTASNQIPNHGMAASQFRIWLQSCESNLPFYREGRNILNRVLYSWPRIPPSNHARLIRSLSPPYGRHRCYSTSSQKTLYDTLGLSPYSGPSEIKRKYYELSKLHHPDRNQGDPTANDRFVEISRAYKVLSDPVSKASYDSSLRLPSAKRDGLHDGRRGPVGGRQAGGLSRRPVSPQGPPPSYYRDRPPRSGTQNSSSFTPRFNWDEKYRQHYVYQERFRKGLGAYKKPTGGTNYSDLSDFCSRAVAVGSCILLVGVLGRWFIMGTNPGT
ncbi:DNAj domain protein [Orbilia blumenaviensis]|uniref:DNAj domain protein n=1 Tax=Orbilia blumenaviensis TaxID=1796055 RepID=A0AAV9U1R0_9PEZI